MYLFEHCFQNGSLPKSGIAGPNGNSMFNFFRNC